MNGPQAAAPWYEMLPRLASDEEFGSARRLFANCGYNEQGVRARLQYKTFEEYLLSFNPERAEHAMADALDVLIRLFTDCLYVDERTLVRALPAGSVETLEALNLLARDAAGPEQLYAPVALYPSEFALTACDRGHSPAGVKCAPPPDVVYPAVLNNTRCFVEWLPLESCEALLDIGTGTGIAAIAAAADTRRVWASDIAARSCHFAEFNRRLAGIENITVVEGDLYAPVEGLTFDCIISHPPYVPAPKPEFIFREGGQDGEQIIRSIVEGLPRHLRPGGWFFAALLGSDREGESFERRIRRWLGERQAEYDVAVFSTSLESPEDHLANMVGQSRVWQQEAQFLRELWAGNKTCFLLHGAVLIRRHPENGRDPVTARMQAGNGVHGRHLRWLLDLDADTRTVEGLEKVLNSAPSVCSSAVHRVVHRVEQGRFVVSEDIFEGTAPFLSSANVPTWVAHMVRACDGARTGRAHFGLLIDKGEIPADSDIHKFARILVTLNANGIIELPGWPRPPLAATV